MYIFYDMIEKSAFRLDEETKNRLLGVLLHLGKLVPVGERFTLEVRTRSGKFFLHVDTRRGVIRPVIPEDSRKTLVSIPLWLLRKTASSKSLRLWESGLERGIVRIDE